MKLLFVTQAVDTEDTVLGAYPAWIAALAARVESVTVICLREGKHNLPKNVRVYSLGKERGRRSRFSYGRAFLSLAWRLRNEYDAAFVHMNQEYILIAGWLWKLLGKPIYMWRNHYAGSVATDIAAAFCAKVFCTSRHSYTAKYAKTVRMPVGVDTDRFQSTAQITRTPRSILFLARMAPSKRPDMLLDALEMLAAKGVSFTVSLYGDPSNTNKAYYDALVARVQQGPLRYQVVFHAGVPNEKTADIYRSHSIVVNCSRSGMFDKTLFEAAGTGALVLATSDDYRSLVGEEYYFTDAHELEERLERMLSLTEEERRKISDCMQDIADTQSLSSLITALVAEIDL